MCDARTWPLCRVTPFTWAHACMHASHGVTAVARLWCCLRSLCMLPLARLARCTPGIAMHYSDEQDRSQSRLAAGKQATGQRLRMPLQNASATSCSQLISSCRSPSRHVHVACAWQRCVNGSTMRITALPGMQSSFCVIIGSASRRGPQRHGAQARALIRDPVRKKPPAISLSIMCAFRFNRPSCSRRRWVRINRLLLRLGGSVPGL